MKGNFKLTIQKDEMSQKDIHGEGELIISVGFMKLYGLSGLFISQDFSLLSIGGEDDDNGMMFKGFRAIENQYCRFWLDFWPKDSKTE